MNSTKGVYNKFNCHIHMHMRMHEHTHEHTFPFSVSLVSITIYHWRLVIPNHTNEVSFGGSCGTYVRMYSVKYII